MPKRKERKELISNHRNIDTNLVQKQEENSPNKKKQKINKTNDLENNKSIPSYTTTSLLRSFEEGGDTEAISLVKSLQRTASFHTKRELKQQLRSINLITPEQQNARKVLSLLRKSFLAVKNYQYSGHSHRWATKTSLSQFQRLLAPLCEAASAALKNDEIIVKMTSPIYILGDLHGNYNDLVMFKDRFWSMGIDMTPARLLFLGDYVDRGPHSVELIAYLFALKVIYPDRVVLLRGNHEFDIQNGALDYNPCFLSNLQELFSKPTAKRQWKNFNTSFEWMPLAAVIDNKIFCCHGGIPRIVKEEKEILPQISKLKRPIDQDSLEEAEDHIAMDLLWSDPATEEQEEDLKDGWFGPNERGEDIIVFGKKAVEEFMKKTGFTHIIRAHQPPDHGIEYSKGARIVTVFSSSHYCGGFNSAAIVLVNESRLRVATSKKMETLIDEVTNDNEGDDGDDVTDSDHEDGVVADESY